MTHDDEWLEADASSEDCVTSHGVTVDTAVEVALTEADDDAEAERVPTDLPALVGVMRDAHEEIDTAKVETGDVAVEVLVCVGQRLHDVALLGPGESFRWNDGLVRHLTPGRFDISVPLDSIWKMFQRGDGEVSTFRSGAHAGMRLARHESAELTYGLYTLYVRCVSKPRPLVQRWDLSRFIPTRGFVAALSAALVLNLIVVALPGKRSPLLVPVAVASEEFVDVSFAQVPREQPVPPLTYPTDRATTPAPFDRPSSQTRPTRTSNPGIGSLDAAELPQKPRKTFVVTPPTRGFDEPIFDTRPAPSARPVPLAPAAPDFGPTPGNLDSAAVRAVVSAHSAEIKACHARSPEANGRFEIAWLVAADGTVHNAHVILDELRSAEMYNCMRRAIESWHFPSPKGGAAVVSFPFRFANDNL